VPDDKPFVPKFGPNGAVINTPGMSDTMHDKLEAAANPPPGHLRKALLGDFGGFVAIGVIVALIMSVGIPLFERMEAQNSFAGKMNAAYLGIPAWGYVGLFILVFSFLTLRAWEVVAAPADKRRIPAPFSVRLGLAVATIVLQAGMLSGMIMVLGGKNSYLQGFGLVVVSWAAHFGLNWFARRRGWTAPPLADDKSANGS
jgi:hypothetical protein